MAFPQSLKTIVSNSKRFLQTEGVNNLKKLPVTYSSLESVLAVLNDEKFRNRDEIRALLEIGNIESNATISTTSAPHPFVVIEGLDGTGKSTVCKLLANEIDGQVLCTPPNCLQELRGHFDASDVKAAFYCLGNYIAANEVHDVLKSKPVILDRYWHSTTAYAVAQAVENDRLDQLPSASSSIYQWPSDLLKPDVVFFLSVGEEERRRRHHQRNTTNTEQEQLLEQKDVFRQNVLTVYSHMNDLFVYNVNADGSPEEVMKIMYDVVKNLIK